jgi:hypothetical protein
MFPVLTLAVAAGAGAGYNFGFFKFNLKLNFKVLDLTVLFLLFILLKGAPLSPVLFDSLDNLKLSVFISSAH